MAAEGSQGGFAVDAAACDDLPLGVYAHQPATRSRGDGQKTATGFGQQAMCAAVQTDIAGDPDRPGGPVDLQDADVIHRTVTLGRAPGSAEPDHIGRGGRWRGLRWPGGCCRGGRQQQSKQGAAIWGEAHTADSPY